MDHSINGAAGLRRRPVAGGLENGVSPAGRNEAEKAVHQVLQKDDRSKGLTKSKQKRGGRGRARGPGAALLGKGGGQYSEFRILLFALSYIVPKSGKIKLLAILSVLFSALAKGCNMIAPLALKRAVEVLSTVENGVIPMPLAPILIYAGAKYGSSSFSHMQAIVWERVSKEITHNFSVCTFSHLHSLSLRYHHEMMTGEVIKVMDKGVSSISTLTKLFVLTVGPTFFEAFLVLAVFLKFDTPGVALVIFLSIIIYTAYSIVLTQWRNKLRKVVNDAESAVSRKSVDSLVNSDVVKCFATEKREVDEYRGLLACYQKKVLNATMSLSFLNNGQSLIRNGTLLITLLLSGRSAAQGTISAGSFIAMNQYVMQVYGPLTWLGTAYRTISRAMTDLEKVIALHDMVPEVRDAPDACPIKFDARAGTQLSAAPMVVFENVSFAYSERDSANGTLRNISFQVPRGSMLAIVGSSGSGKTTIVRLLLRLYDVTSGRVLISGQDVRSVTQESLRKGIGVVAQDTSLFNNTLRFNIAYGKPDASDEEILAAAKAAALDDFIAEQPKGLDTLCGERGIRLSGGERQRVGLARCILKDPAVILLDESTSSLDTVTERRIQKNLKHVCTGRTTVAIAHRISTIMMADQIIVVDGGKVVERGTHEELLKSENAHVYAKMWNAQLKAQDSGQRGAEAPLN